MDAVNLALPAVSRIVGPAGAPGDQAALTEEGNGAAIDFATLLAAGLGLQDPPADPALVAATDAAADAQEDPLAGTATPAADALATPVAPSALPIAAPVEERPALSHHQASRDAADERAAAAQLLTRQGAGAAQTAADAARFAARTAEEAQEAVAAATDRGARFADEMQASVDAAEPPRAEAAQVATQTLNLQATEQRPSVQQPVAVREVGAPVGSTGFADALSRQVVWMVDKDAQIAELRINPPDLGPVEVRLSVSGDQASAQFVSTHAEVREAIESSIARLRESFAEAGIQLGEASVSAESFRDRTPDQADARHPPAGYAGSSETAGSPSSAAAAPRVHHGLVDTFA
jgi:flagellar hook-length control protein FliK